MQIALSHVVFVRLKPLMGPREEDATALATVLRFYNKSFGLSLIKLLLETFRIAGQKPSFWEKLEVGLEVLLHPEQMLGQEIFARHRCHAWEVIGPLV